MRSLTILEDPTLWTPNDGGQQGFMDNYTSRYCALAGGWYAGKTWAGARKLIDLHVYNAFDDEGDPTGVASAVIAQTYQLAHTINIIELKRAMDEAGIAYKFVADAKKFWFELPDLASPREPSLILVRSADVPNKITGWTVGAIWGDEVARWKTCQPDEDPSTDPLIQAKGRLRDPRAKFRQFMMTFTHEGDTTRVYRDFEEDPKPKHKLYRAGTFQNPHARDFAADQKSQLTPTLATQYLDGFAANFRGGNVYDNFDFARNTDAAIALDPKRPLQLALDFNINPGMHGIVGQWNPAALGGQLLTAVAELYEDRINARRFVPLFVRWLTSATAALPARGDGSGWTFPGKLELYGDATGASGQAATGESCWQVICEGLANAGIPYSMANVPSANPHVADRVQSVNCAFCALDGRVRYKVHPSCVRLIGDFKTMKWEGNEIDKSDRKRSHASDADGYRVFQLLPVRRGTATRGSYAAV